MVLFDHVRGVDSAEGLGPALTRLAREVLDSGEALPDGALAGLARSRLSPDRVLALAAEGDPDAVRVVREAGAFLARVVAVLGSTYDPERVIVCGAIAEGIQPVLDATRDVLRPLLDLPAPTLLRSRLGADIVLAGAVSTALAGARSTGLPRLVAERLRG